MHPWVEVPRRGGVRKMDDGWSAHQAPPIRATHTSERPYETPAQKGQAFGGLYSYELTMARLCMERSYHQ